MLAVRPDRLAIVYYFPNVRSVEHTGTRGNVGGFAEDTEVSGTSIEFLPNLTVGIR